MSANRTTPPAPVLLGCAKCGAALPDEAQFCLKCGKPVSAPPRKAQIIAELPSETLPALPRKKRRIVLWLILALLAAGITWIVVSDNPFAQAAQEMVGFKHDQTVLDTPFTVGPHSFRYYKFALPEGSVNVSVVGDFTSAGDLKTISTRKNSKDQAQPDNNIQVFVLSEAAFTIWQNGYATSSLYDSGMVSQGKVQCEVPAGAGIYYLVFNNRFATKSPKAIQAAVVLRYKSWLPEWVRSLKERFLNWVGA